NQQKLLLERRVREVVAYLQAPTFEEYYRLKTGNLKFDFKLKPVAQSVLTNSGVSNYLFSGPHLNETLAQLWNMYHLTNGVPRVTALCMDYIATTTTRSNSMAALLKGK